MIRFRWALFHGVLFQGVLFQGPPGYVSCALAILVAVSMPRLVCADVVTLPSGAQYEGAVERISAVGESPITTSGGVPTGPIILIDDELRFVLVPNSVDVKYTASPPKNVERIKIQQLLATGGRRIGAVGRVLEITPWDNFGRRRFSMEGGPTGRIDVVQGISLVTPTYTRIEGLQSKNPLVWDLRVATTSIAPETLRQVLLRAAGEDAKGVDARLRVVRLFIQAEMYKEAIRELAQIGKEFPDVAESFREQETRLVQLLAQQFLRDIELRRNAGQHQHVMARLANFPDQGVAGETLIKVRDMLQEYDNRKMQYDQSLAQFEKHLEALTDDAIRVKLMPFHEELKRELSIHNLDRMADYLRLADDASMTVDQKVALAVSGFLLGSGAGLENLAVASSLVEVRDLVVQYLRSTLVTERQEILDKLQSLEGSSPAYVAKLLAHVKPPLESQEVATGVPGLYELTTKGIEEQPEFSYLVQLPPEYHSSRRYPCIVTLNGFDRSEQDQIDWWAGPYAPQKSMRLGQAWRRGYIVIAPKWQKPLQGEYEYSLREHAAVLFTLRDACQRLSIDTDRVYLSGHVQGGDAAWDIALAHPDLWAGAVLFTPRADRYVTYYSANQRQLPFYFVAGEKDAGTNASGPWLDENATELNRYLGAPRSDCTVVLYRGRGRDGFSDEIHRIFDWMELPSHRRNFAPRTVKFSSMRPWDNFFWWLEVDGFPPQSMVLPHAWPPEKGTRATTMEAEIIAANGRIQVKASSDRVTVWLSPEIADFTKEVQVAVDGKEIRGEIKPNLEVMLEDVRSRGDRQHPFWARADWPERTGKR